jgi:MFS family permease
MKRHFVHFTYLFPLLIDAVVALICFVNSVRFAKFGMTPSKVAAVFTVLNLIYLFSTLAISRIVGRNNAWALMMIGCLLYSVICLAFPFTAGINLMFVLIGATAVAGALFFPAFQVFMKTNAQETSGSLTVSTGLYGMSWSTGFAIGPLMAGYLMGQGALDAAGVERTGWKYAYAAATFLALATLVGLWLFGAARRRAAESEESTRNEPSAAADNYSNMPDLAWLGWTAAFVGVMVYYAARGVLPSRFTNVLKLSEQNQGILFFIISFAQALTSLALCLGKTWMYRPVPVAAFSIAGVLGFVAFGTAGSWHALCVASVLFGIYSGGFYYYLVFHSVVHPTKSARYVSFNEAIVGAGGILGPLAAGMLATRFGYAAAFIAGGGLMLAIMVIQIWAHARTRIPSPRNPATIFE